MNVRAAIAMYLRHHQAEGSRPKTLRWHEQSLGLFSAQLEDGFPISDLRADDLRAFILNQQQRGLSQATVQTRARSVKAWGRWMAEEELLPKDPFARVQRPRMDDAPKATFVPQEVDRLLAGIQGDGFIERRDRAIILMLYSTGLRASELLNIALDDIDFGQGVIVIRRGKGGKLRVVPLGQRVAKGLNRYLAVRPEGRTDKLFVTSFGGRQLSFNALASMLRRRGLAVDIHVNPHKFGHSAAVQYLRGGGRVEALRSLLGHSTLDLTLHYARLAGVDLVEAHARFDPAGSLRTRI